MKIFRGESRRPE